ncbi:MAG: hypothetical protein IPL52_10925 [Flavobacteriales bacterium]|nr:hypothetical protein [Flavobacteriales bacterium]
MKQFLIAAVLLAPTLVFAQAEDLAYVPSTAPARTADDASIGFRDRSEPGPVELVLPPGTYQVDLLNAQGTSSAIDRATVPNWTCAPGSRAPGPCAHCPGGLRVRRFVVLGRGGAHVGAAEQPLTRANVHSSPANDRAHGRHR